MQRKTGIAIDARGQMIGRATQNADGIDVRLSVKRSEIVHPIRFVWDTMAPGAFEYQPGVVIA